ncbi:hypothetical protein FQN53_005149 [Emmonsiellopsis sp. PD_33]|nr:hypothetical protein FQN53_005149 [Emmonsiellopsis sp. PD_33]
MSSKKPQIPPSIRDILSRPSTTALETFDPWNSASTGHQRAEKSQTAAPEWQQVRSQKLGSQFGDRSGRGGGYGAGEWDWVTSEEYQENIRREQRTGDIRALMGGVKKRRLDGGMVETKQIATQGRIDMSIKKGNGAFVLEDSDGDGGGDRASKRPQIQSSCGAREISTETHKNVGVNPPPQPISQSTIPASNPTRTESSPIPQSTSPDKIIFENLNIYINGSTYPLVSEHKLKQLLVSNGATVSLGLARRSVTHVILGRPNNTRSGNGAGGGLSGRKLQQEIQRVGGKGVKFVGVEWVLESLKAGCRLSEARFATLHMAPDKQRSVMSMFKRAE